MDTDGLEKLEGISLHLGYWSFDNELLENVDVMGHPFLTGLGLHTLIKCFEWHKLKDTLTHVVFTAGYAPYRSQPDREELIDVIRKHLMDYQGSAS